MFFAMPGQAPPASRPATPLAREKDPVRDPSLAPALSIVLTPPDKGKCLKGT